jgi:hypothetical protein
VNLRGVFSFRNLATDEGSGKVKRNWAGGNQGNREEKELGKPIKSLGALYL